MTATLPAPSSTPEIEEAPLTAATTTATRSQARGTEFIAMMAGLMSLNALAIDIMLPALPAMGADFDVGDPNHRQYVVIAYVLGMGAAQLFFGPVADRFGRRAPLLASLVAYAVFGGICVVAPSFTVLVVARALQGVAAAGGRVISLSVIRDIYRGQRMARVLSLTMMVFMAMPMLAPNIGKVVMLAGPWRWVFAVLVAFGLLMTAWVAMRLGETLPEDDRRPLSPRSLLAAYAKVVTTRVSFGYVLASGVVFGALFAFISSSEQLYGDVFGRRDTFTLYFASVAGGMAVSAFVNANLVERWGMRRLAHGALVGFVLINVVSVALLESGVAGFASFHVSMMASFFCFSFIGANFNSLAMEPLGSIAGTASAALGFTSTMLAGLLGGAVGQRFDGTATPVIVGFLGLGVVALLIVLVTEQGRLFRPD